MRTIDSIIAELQAGASNPKKAMDDYKKATGKGAVGIMPVYSPEELVYAAGYLPMGMWGGSKSISKARAFLPPFACSIMQEVMELELEGAYDDLEAVVFSVPCDTLKCMSQKWKGKCPTITFTHPQNRKIAAANVFTKGEYEVVKEKLEQILGVKITDEAIENSIKVYNANRQAMRAFSDLAAEYPNIITPAKRHAVIKARHFMEKSQHTALVNELIEAVKKTEKQPWTGKKVILTGIMAEPDGLLDILQANNFAVVADDLAQEGRQFRVDVEENTGDPLMALAKAWQALDGCSLATDPEKPRGKMLIDMAKKYNADAVIVCMMKFCDPEEWDYPILIQEFEKAGVKNIQIEVDQEATSYEQTKTRLQSFSEIL